MELSRTASRASCASAIVQPGRAWWIIARPIGAKAGLDGERLVTSPIGETSGLGSLPDKADNGPVVSSGQSAACAGSSRPVSANAFARSEAPRQGLTTGCPAFQL